MRSHQVAFSAAVLLSAATLAMAAENVSAEGYSKDALVAFGSGDYKRAAKLLEKANRLDSTNTVLREKLGLAYERQAESAAFPIGLTTRARNSFVRALELDNTNTAAIVDLIDLATQPIGLCQGNLEEAALLVDRLAQLDPAAAQDKKMYLDDAKADAAHPGQRVLCGSVKVARLPLARIFPTIPVTRKMLSDSTQSARFADPADVVVLLARE